jgi:hypothetical protein
MNIKRDKKEMIKLMEKTDKFQTKKKKIPKNRMITKEGNDGLLNILTFRHLA